MPNFHGNVFLETFPKSEWEKNVKLRSHIHMHRPKDKDVKGGASR